MAVRIVVSDVITRREVSFASALINGLRYYGCKTQEGLTTILTNAIDDFSRSSEINSSSRNIICLDDNEHYPPMSRP